jgi:hypothetical protein
MLGTVSVDGMSPYLDFPAHVRASLLAGRSYGKSPAQAGNSRSDLRLKKVNPPHVLKMHNTLAVSTEQNVA